MTHKPIIMVAPNGARKTKQDHPYLPTQISETVSEAKRCFDAGATILHAHVRDSDERHVLDARLYQRLFAEMAQHVPTMRVQMTTEAVGLYSPEQQAKCVYSAQPKMISVSLEEMAGNNKYNDLARRFYHWCHENRVHIQHIVYHNYQLDMLFERQRQGIIPDERLCVLFVLGRYSDNQQALPEDIESFLAVKGDAPIDWFVCAFGQHEQACMMVAIEQGGHARVGFENNLVLSDGRQAEHTADLVASLVSRLAKDGIMIADSQETTQILGLT